MNTVDYDKIVVMDMGSYQCKTGFASDTEPRSIRSPTFDDENSDSSNSSAVNSLIQEGTVVDWDNMVLFMERVFKEDLQCLPQNSCLFICDSVHSPEQSREKALEIAFEKLNIKGFYAAFQPVPAVLATGHSTGIVIDSGYDYITVSPVMNSYVLNHSIKKSLFGGRRINEIFVDLLRKRPENRFDVNAESPVITALKEKLCFLPVELSREQYISTEPDAVYDLSDGQYAIIGNERYMSTEPIFTPHLINANDEKGLAMVIRQSILSSAKYGIQNSFEEAWSEDVFYSNVVVTGGSSKLKGFIERTQKETSIFAPNHSDVKIMTTMHRQNGAWTGAALWAQQDLFVPMWITRDYYDENGTEGVHYRCLA